MIQQVNMFVEKNQWIYIQIAPKMKPTYKDLLQCLHIF